MHNHSSQVTPCLLSIILILEVILVFNLMIVAHEWGHFLAARWRGLKIERFSIGFGPKIISWTRGGVEYRISWIPFGGYVALPQLADMSEIEGKSESSGEPAEPLPPISYTTKIIVFGAGAVFNLIFAFFLGSIMWFVGQPVAAVAAESRAAAETGAAMLVVDYEPLDAVASLGAALAEGTLQLWPEAPGNVAAVSKFGDAAACEAAFARAQHVTRLHVSQSLLGAKNGQRAVEAAGVEFFVEIHGVVSPSAPLINRGRTA